MSKRGYYIHECMVKDGVSLFPGVGKKIQFQINVFAKHFLISEISLPDNGLVTKICKRIPFINIKEWNEILHDIHNPNFIYIRKPFIEGGFVCFLRKTKEKYPSCKIILELPTYPYDGELLQKNYKLVFNIPIFIKEKFYRCKLFKYVDVIATYSNNKKIWGIPTINLKNGVDVSTIKLHNKRYKGSIANEINLISVASMQPHHGYDRVIKGLKSYYEDNPQKKVIYHVVGNGGELENYKRMVKKYNLEQYVIFYGPLYGEKLDKVYDIADIAIGSLGMHRIGLKSGSTLKTREYLAKGIPFIYAGGIDVFEGKDIDFALQVTSNDSAVDIHKVVMFYDNLAKYETGLTEFIRKFAYEEIDINQVFMPIINYINQ